MANSIEDIEFLARSEHRVAALRTLDEGPRDRDELRAATEASKATVARLLNEFDDRNWVVRDGNQYELTDLGEFVAEEFLQLVDRMETERTLRDVWRWFPTDLPGFTVRMLSGVVVSFPEPDQPYRSTPRFVELVESAQALRGFSARSLKPTSYEAIVRNAVDGMESELIIPPAVTRDMLTAVSEETLREAIESGHLTVLENDSYPMESGFALFDDRLSLWGRDEKGVVRAGLDTGSADAIDWGESVYEDVRSGARVVDVLELVA